MWNAFNIHSLTCTLIWSPFYLRIVYILICMRMSIFPSENLLHIGLHSHYEKLQFSSVYKVIIMMERSAKCAVNMFLFWFVKVHLWRVTTTANTTIPRCYICCVIGLPTFTLTFRNEFPSVRYFLAENNCRIVPKYLNNTFLMVFKTRNYCPPFRTSEYIPIHCLIVIVEIVESTFTYFESWLIGGKLRYSNWLRRKHFIAANCFH